MHFTSRFRLSPEVAQFAITQQMLPMTAQTTPPWKWGEVIGQPRALEALKLAVSIRAKGFNLFVAGQPGTGKRTTVLRYLKNPPLR